MNLKNNNRILVMSVFLLAIMARLSALFFVEPISHPNTWEYEEIANNLLKGNGLYYNFYGIPYRATYIVLYPLLCALVYFFTNHSFLALKILQIIISLLTCLLVYRIALRIFNQKIAILSLFLVSLHPGLVYYSVRLHSLVLDTFLYALSIFLFLKILDGKNIYRTSILCGIIFGLALLSRTAIGLFLPIVFLIFFMRYKVSPVLFYRAVLLITVFITLTLFPLWIRNYLVFNKIVLTPTESGLAFWLGYNDNATGTNKTLGDRFIFDVAPEQFRYKILSMDEFGQKKYFYEEGRDFIKKHPIRSLSLFFKKIKYFWWFTPTQGMEYPKTYLYIYKFYWIFILLFFLIGLYKKIRHAYVNLNDIYPVTLIILFLITMTLVHASFNLDGRHRWIVESFILIFAANGILAFADFLKKII
ncbi:MAG: glycosyltransferase family 39 protein [Candidatus Omnitrophota bacterium]